jgi:hypothetical protein
MRVNSWDLYGFKSELEKKLESSAEQFDDVDDAYGDFLKVYESMPDDEFIPQADKMNAELDRLSEERKRLREIVEALTEAVEKAAALEEVVEYLESEGIQ